MRNGTDPSSSPVYLILSRFATRFKKKSASEYEARKQKEVLSPILERECDYSRVGSLKEIRSEGRRRRLPSATWTTLGLESVAAKEQQLDFCPKVSLDDVGSRRFPSASRSSSG